MAISEQPNWTLRRHGRVIAEFNAADQDMFWLSAEIKRLAGFEEVAPFFDADLQFLNNPSPSAQEIADWEALSDKFEADTFLVKPDGTRVAEFLLHIDGDEAFWRWSDEPFE